jgi:hypothetical protein
MFVCLFLVLVGSCIIPIRHSFFIGKSRIVNNLGIASVIRSKMTLNNENNNRSNKRKIVRYDNVGDPIYEDEEFAVSSSQGMNILGLKVALDPSSLTLIIFGLIAFNFFILANL